MRLDRYDIQILQLLHQKGRITKSQLADTIHLSISPCWERVKKLEQQGIIKNYQANIDIDKLFKRTTILLEVSLKEHHAQALADFEHRMQICEWVEECYATGGGIDYLVKVKSLDIDHYQRLVDEWLDADLGIERYFTYIVTKTIKSKRDDAALLEHIAELNQ